MATVATGSDVEVCAPVFPLLLPLLRTVCASCPSETLQEHVNLKGLQKALVLQD